MSKLFTETGIPLLRGQNILPYKLNLTSLKFISKETHQKWRKSSLEPGDVVMVRVGHPGTSCVIPKGCGDLNAASLVIAKPDLTKINPHFLSFFLNSKKGQGLIKNFLVGSVQQVLNVSTAGELLIPNPPLETQNKVAKILREINDKIELNRKMNQTLESMAQALFQSWFVDFDPVLDNALAAGNPIPESLQKKAAKRNQAEVSNKLINTNPALAKLFPSTFVFNETLNKWIPEGWEVNGLDNFISVKHGYAFKGEFFSEEPTNDILLTPGNFKIGGGIKFSKLKYYNGEIPKDYVLKKDDMLITMTDLSKEGDTLGYPAFVPEDSEQTFLHNQRLGKVEFKNEALPKHYLYQCLCRNDYRQIIVGGASGTTVKHTSPSKILLHNILFSGGELEGVFEKQSISIFKKIEINNAEIKILSTTRDTLLPKLISGKIKV